MKKNDSIKDKNPKAEEFTAKNIPSEKIRFKDKEERELQFKKILYGYDPEEVVSYINELNRTYETASKIYESKLSSLKEELVLSNRERNSCIEKLRNVQTENSTANQPKEDKSVGYEAIIAQLSETVENLKSENARLQNIPATDEKDVTDCKQRITELEDTVNLLQSENLNLIQQINKYSSFEEEYKSVLMQLENTKVQLASKEKELITRTEELAEKSNKTTELSAENLDIKAKIAELEIKNGVLMQSETERENEISVLKEVNKNMAFENAEKINALENEYAKSKLEMQKELKLYGYYVERANLTLSELTKQMDQIKQALVNTQS